MKIINAEWEKRNLGVTAQEVDIESGDSISDIKEALACLIAQYRVVRVPSGMVAIHFALEKLGYNFIEAMTCLEVKSESYNGGLKQYGLLNQVEQEYLMKIISTGFFNTDRISLDSFFSSKDAANRYINWIDNERKRGAVIISLLNDSLVVGFSVIRQHVDDKEVFISSLSGIFPEHAGNGYSSLIAGCGLAYVKDNGGRVLRTAVSCNNIASLKGHIKGGYLPVSTCYVFVKHEN